MIPLNDFGWYDEIYYQQRYPQTKIRLNSLFNKIKSSFFWNFD